MNNNTRPWVAATVTAAAAALVSAAFAQSPSTAVADEATLKRGRYLVTITQCNNCHTDGYSASGGAVSETKWLAGNSRNWLNRDGAVYATNLRLLASEISVDAWVHLSKHSRARPPMPWWSLRDMAVDDLKAMFWFIRSLGPTGQPAKPFEPAPPGAPPPPPEIHQ
jgi:mono/diheme cytochrome c family protein